MLLRALEGRNSAKMETSESRKGWGFITACISNSQVSLDVHTTLQQLVRERAAGEGKEHAAAEFVKV